jgi:DNA gyrase/topoisomerase IV subunit B
MSKSKKVEEIWKELTPEEHVLRKPGMYLGSVKKQVSEMWLYEDNKMIAKYLVEKQIDVMLITKDGIKKMRKNYYR